MIDNNPFERKLKNIKLEIGNNLETLRNYFKLEVAKNKIKINIYLIQFLIYLYF